MLYCFFFWHERRDLECSPDLYPNIYYRTRLFRFRIERRGGLERTYAPIILVRSIPFFTERISGAVAHFPRNAMGIMITAIRSRIRRQ